MNIEQLGYIARDVNIDLLKMGLSDAEIMFIGMNLVSYAIAETAIRIQSAQKDDIGGLVKEP